MEDLHGIRSDILSLSFFILTIIPDISDFRGYLFIAVIPYNIFIVNNVVFATALMGLFFYKKYFNHVEEIFSKYGKKLPFLRRMNFKMVHNHYDHLYNHLHKNLKEYILEKKHVFINSLNQRMIV